MKIEKQVCSLENAKRLEELGVKQESVFYWIISLTTNYHLSYTEGDKKLLPKDRNDFYSAFTVAELMTILGEVEYESIGFPILVLYKNEGKWNCYHRNPANWNNPDIATDNIADAPAEYLIWLIENKHIKVENL